MPHLSSSAKLVLPFGSLMGSIPMDSAQPVRALGDFSGILAGQSSLISEFLAAVSFRGCCYTACAASPPSLTPRRDGGI
jgi:hypothetical protein